MEIRWLRPLPRACRGPQTPEIVWVDFDKQGRDFPGTGQMGYIMDEDMENMEEVHRGMKATDPAVARPISGNRAGNSDSAFPRSLYESDGYRNLSQR